MNKDKKLVPELRFPEFRNVGEWEEKQLDEISTLTMGSSPSSLSYNLEKVGLPLIQGNADIKNRFSSPRLFTSEITKECFIGDILLSVRAPVGTVSKSLHNACIGRGICAIKAIENQEFLYQSLILKENSWNRISQGGTFDAVNSENIKQFKLFAPKLEEQQKIADCLSSLDELIAAHTEKLQLVKDHKKGLMQNLFPQKDEKVPNFRFPEFRNKGDWEEMSLGEVAGKIGDGIHTTPKYDAAGEYFFINGNNLSNGKIMIDEKTKRVSTEEFELYKKNITEGTILLSINGTIGNIAFYNNEKVVLGKSACYLEIKKQYSNVYMYNYLQCSKIITYFNSELTGSTIRNLSLKSIREAKIQIPILKEQQKIAATLSALDELITAQTEKIEQLKQHKKGLMQGLFPKIEN